MIESENESKPKRTIKPGRWVFGTTIAVLFIAIVIFGTRIYRFYAAVDAVERLGGIVLGESPEWIEKRNWNLRYIELFYSDRIGVYLDYPYPFESLPSESTFDDSDLERLIRLIPHLQQFDTLYRLSLNGTNISDEGLSYLVDFDHLWGLRIWRADISDHGLQHISRIKNLKLLSLDNCNITDEGIRHLQNLKRLEVLTLDGTDVTDEGLKHLLSLKNLKHLSLSNTGVTDEGCAELLKAIPDLEILDD